jgi:hypothetical protein
MMEMYMKETIKRVQQDQPVILSHSDIRKCYAKESTTSTGKCQFHWGYQEAKP